MTSISVRVWSERVVFIGVAHFICLRFISCSLASCLTTFHRLFLQQWMWDRKMTFSTFLQIPTFKWFTPNCSNPSYTAKPNEADPHSLHSEPSGITSGLINNGFHWQNRLQGGVNLRGKMLYSLPSINNQRIDLAPADLPS